MDDEDLDLVFITEQISAESLAIINCPFCSEDIPIITFDYSLGQITLNIQCTCSTEIKTISLNDYLSQIKAIKYSRPQCIEHNVISNKYCLECRLWFCMKCLSFHNKMEATRSHSVINYQLKLMCLKHKQHISAYCFTCNESICNECKSTHGSHELNPLTKIDPDKFAKNCHEDNVIISNRINQRYNEIDKRIDDKISKLQEEIIALRKMKEEIKLVYESNNKMNQLLSAFNTTLVTTANVLSQIPIYSLSHLLETIIPNPQDVIYTKNSLQDNITEFKQYLQSNYVFTQKPVISPQPWKQEDNIIANANKSIKAFPLHSKWIQCLKELQNDQIATGSGDNTIKIWDSNTMKCNATLTGHTQFINCLYQTALGLLVSGSGDNTLRIWDLKLYSCLNTLKGHKSIINSITQIKDDQIASCSDDNSIMIWDVNLFSCICTLNGHTSYVYSILLLSNNVLVSASEDMQLILWDLQWRMQKKKMKEHTDAITCLIQSKADQLISGSVDKTIKVWDLNTFGVITTLSGHNDAITCVIVLNNDTLCSASEDCSIRVWNLNDYSCVGVLSGHTDKVNCLLQLDSDQIVSCSDDESVRYWSIKEMKSVDNLIDNKTQLNDMILLSSKCAFVLGANNGEIVVINNLNS